MKSTHYTACGGVVIAADRVLVLLRPSRGEIRLPKGRLEPGEDVEAAARREVAEESGFVDLELVADLGEVTNDFDMVDTDGSLLHVTRDERYFLYRLTSSERIEQHPDDVEEFTPDFKTFDEALTALTYDGEREWVRRAVAQIPS